MMTVFRHPGGTPPINRLKALTRVAYFTSQRGPYRDPAAVSPRVSAIGGARLFKPGDRLGAATAIRRFYMRTGFIGGTAVGQPRC
jgi:hypothetical protein